MKKAKTLKINEAKIVKVIEQINKELDTKMNGYSLTLKGIVSIVVNMVEEQLR